MRPANAYFISAMVHVFALAAVGGLSLNESVQYQVASGEPIIVQFSLAAPEQRPPQPVMLEVTEVEPAPPLPEEEFRPQEHAIAPQPLLVERAPTAEVGEEPARAEPSPKAEASEKPPTRVAAQPKAPQPPEPTPHRPERQVTTEVAMATTTAMQAQLAQQAGAKVDVQPMHLPANPEPPYPQDAWRAGAEGQVVLRVTVAETGLVERASVETSSGWASFDDSAVTTIRRWRFQPAQRAGAAVSFEFLLPVRFQLRRS